MNAYLKRCKYIRGILTQPIVPSVSQVHSFELVKSIKKMKKLDALRLKKYYSYYIKIGMKNSVEETMKNLKASLDHTFDEH